MPGCRWSQPLEGWMVSSRLQAGGSRALPLTRSVPTSIVFNILDVLLGPYGSQASKAEYNRVVAEWLEQGRRQPAAKKGSADSLSINVLILAYWRHAEAYYGFVDRPGERGDEACLRDALRMVRSL